MAMKLEKILFDAVDYLRENDNFPDLKKKVIQDLNDCVSIAFALHRDLLIPRAPVIIDIDGAYRYFRCSVDYVNMNDYGFCPPAVALNFGLVRGKYGCMMFRTSKAIERKDKSQIEERIRITLNTVIDGIDIRYLDMNNDPYERLLLEEKALGYV